MKNKQKNKELEELRNRISVLLEDCKEKEKLEVIYIFILHYLI